MQSELYLYVWYACWTWVPVRCQSDLYMYTFDCGMHSELFMFDMHCGLHMFYMRSDLHTFDMQSNMYTCLIRYKIRILTIIINIFINFERRELLCVVDQDKIIIILKSNFSLRRICHISFTKWQMRFTVTLSDKYDSGESSQDNCEAYLSFCESNDTLPRTSFTVYSIYCRP
jgi:hypothetical protein